MRNAGLIGAAARRRKQLSQQKLGQGEEKNNEKQQNSVRRTSKAADDAAAKWLEQLQGMPPIGLNPEDARTLLALRERASLSEAAPVDGRWRNDTAVASAATAPATACQDELKVIDGIHPRGAMGDTSVVEGEADVSQGPRSYQPQIRSPLCVETGDAPHEASEVSRQIDDASTVKMEWASELCMEMEIGTIKSEVRSFGTNGDAAKARNVNHPQIVDLE